MTNLPPGWAETTLGEVADTSLGKMLDRGKATGEHAAPYLRNMNVQWGRINLYNVLTMDIRPEERDFFRLEPGDLLVCEGGEIGRCAIWPGQTGYMGYQKALHRVRPHRGVDAKYLRYLMEYMSLAGLFVPYSTGSTIRHLPQQQLRRICLHLPPTAEQHRIVVALDDYLYRIARAESQRATAAKRMESLRHSILNAAVTPSVITGPTEARDGPVGLKGRSGKKIDYSYLPDLPCGWKWRVAEEICEKIVCGGTPKANLMYPGSGNIPFLKVYNLTQDGGLDFTIRPTFIDHSTHQGLLKRSKVRPGDVLTNIVGPPLGKTAVVPESYEEWNINQAIVAFRAGPEISASWLALVLQAPSILRLLSRTARATAGQFNIALSTCRELPLPVPPRATQEEICRQATELISKSKMVLRGMTLAEAWRARLRTQVLREAFAGRLVEQDPADEPASVLLERIRAERAARGSVWQMRRANAK